MVAVSSLSINGLFWEFLKTKNFRVILQTPCSKMTDSLVSV
jgi:hypothetical protein